MGSPIPNAKAIYEKVKNQWNQGQGLCDSSKLDIEGGCQVSFECSVNDNKDTKIMDDLINRLLTLAEKDETFNGREEHTCSMKGTNRESCQYYQKLDLPSVIQFRVTSIPHSLATTGHERARLKAEVTCPPEPTEAEKWCSAIKTLFGFGGSFPGSVVPAVGAAGGAGAEAICGGLLW
jgi:hypothetical protein